MKNLTFRLNDLNYIEDLKFELPCVHSVGAEHRRRLTTISSQAAGNAIILYMYVGTLCQFTWELLARKSEKT